ncbi:unnamed protein product [Coffea canephora]|uniref:Uncharacterized protein n=1 Tax=Coffea canephora TaxID=49390 RepID=A0A068UE98_COFCA|nr:unnamed protein product [Coffea canephora]
MDAKDSPTANSFPKKNCNFIQIVVDTGNSDVPLTVTIC